jgi:hypothetical protein
LAIDFEALQDHVFPSKDFPELPKQEGLSIATYFTVFARTLAVEWPTPSLNLITASSQLVQASNFAGLD